MLRLKYFQELKLRKAKQMLVGTSQSVKEISFFSRFPVNRIFFLFLQETYGTYSVGVSFVRAGRMNRMKFISISYLALILGIS